MLVVAVLVAACHRTPADTPETGRSTPTTKVTVNIGEPAVLDRDDPNFTR